jgi:four helix bundle protein
MIKFKTQNHNLNRKADLRKRSFGFSLITIKFVGNLPNKRVYWIIADQLLRSATSIGANIIEAKSSSSKRDFIRFYEIALKSSNETKYWLYLLRDGNLVEASKVEKLIKEAEEIANMLGSSLLTLKGKKRSNF